MVGKWASKKMKCRKQGENKGGKGENLENKEKGNWKKEFRYQNFLFFFSLFFISGVPQRLDAGDLGRPTRYCYLESIYRTWDGGTDHWASLVSHPTQCVAVLGGLH